MGYLKTGGGGGGSSEPPWTASGPATVLLTETDKYNTDSLQEFKMFL